MSEEPMMICDFCKKEFPADSRAVCDAGVIQEVEEGEEWKTIQGIDLKEEEREDLKKAFDLNDKEVDELLKTGHVDGLGAIVCLQCQDKAVEDTENND